MPSLDGERRRLAQLYDIAPSRILSALCTLGIPDHIPAEGISTGKLAATLRMDSDRLLRLLLAAETLGVVCIEQHTVRVTPAGTLLRSDQPGGLHAEFTDNSLFAAWTPFAETLTTGRPSYELHHGQHVFDRLRHDPDGLETFHQHMRTRAMHLYRPLVPFLLDHCTIDVLDLGGGTGGLAELLLTATTTLKVTLVDRPEVISLVPPHLAGQYDARFTAVAGDITEGVPLGGSAYLLGSVLHDWPDETAIKILSRCREALSSTGVIILLERVLDDGPDPGRLSDMWMMAMTGGKERTRTEWAGLAEAADLTLRHIHKNQHELAAVLLTAA
ncbi:methyltransferase [Streptomyces sp. NPDC056716]|uniref:methyltransferase n=1 Tax=unclassified Streptomyces TaxID=2593676 RepID=UPI0036AC87DB